MDVPRKYIRKNFSTKSVRINDEIVSPSKNRINEDMTKYNNRLNSNEHILFTRTQRKKSFKRNTKYGSSKKIIEFNKIISNENLSNLRKETNSKASDNNNIEIEFKSCNSQEEALKPNVIKKIKVSRACIYLCFCYTRRRKIVQNALIDEGMNIISEKLDIFNIFDKLYRDEKIQEKLTKIKLIEMSDECKTRLQSISNYLNI